MMPLLVEEGRCKEVGGAGGSHCPQKGLREDKLMGGATAQGFIIKIERMSNIHVEGWPDGDSAAL